MPADLLEPAWNEVSINLVFGDDGDYIQHGLEPFYAAERIVRDNDGALRSRCQLDDYITPLYWGDTIWSDQSAARATTRRLD